MGWGSSSRGCTDATAGETIPIRLFLGGFDLTPTFLQVNKKYSTRYYLSLVLIDEGAFLQPPDGKMFFRPLCAPPRITPLV